MSEKQTTREKTLSDNLENEYENEINIDSFINVQEEISDKKTGLVRLKDVEKVESYNDMPTKHAYFRHNFEDEKKLVFDAEFISDPSKKVKVVVPYYSEGERLKKLAGVDNISNLANSKVPVRKLNDDLYMIKNSPNYTPIFIEKYLMKNNFIDYANGSWSKTLKTKNLLNILSYMIFGTVVFSFTITQLFTSVISTLVTFGAFIVVLYSIFRLLKYLE